MYIRVLPDEILLKSTVTTTDFKRNSSGSARIYEYSCDVGLPVRVIIHHKKAK